MDHVDHILKQWRQERPDLDVDPMGTIGRVKRLNHALMRAMEKTWAKYGLTDASFDVLATLRREGAPYALSPSDLMASTMVTSGTMTHRINLLEKAGLIERVKNPEDGRGFLISLSQRGFDLIDEAVAAHVETQAQLVSGLTDEQRQQLDALLRQFLAGVEQE
ncbi:MarR family winged helix-turn-helix transcriptional regulator [Vreelandella maris]|uniref:MarR family transcriptional regulator n=1 Tax=Vreelandella maris TaxID=2729617 RepID=A0A7Y6R932_9GAMM|nr:MarR family transcriptional regulator [Halomonas maris]NVF12626.1 MarR family transcriptional regulator [Halomonas maris]|tara:strand:+ start:814 stop:1302 length:489 start_codon:yes stop_codon:yes gene_type:complete